MLRIFAAMVITTNIFGYTETKKNLCEDGFINNSYEEYTMKEFSKEQPYTICLLERKKEIEASESASFCLKNGEVVMDNLGEVYKKYYEEKYEKTVIKKHSQFVIIYDEAECSFFQSSWTQK